MQKDQERIPQEHIDHLVLVTQAVVWGINALAQPEVTEEGDLSITLQGTVAASYDPRSDKLTLELAPRVTMASARALETIPVQRPVFRQWMATNIQRVGNADQIVYQASDRLAIRKYDVRLIFLGIAMVVLATILSGIGLQKLVDKALQITRSALQDPNATPSSLAFLLLSTLPVPIRTQLLAYRRLLSSSSRYIATSA